MSAESVLREAIHEADLVEQRQSREVLRQMFRTSQLSQLDLTRVATVARMERKSLLNLTIQDLISMGLVTVEEQAAAGAA